MKNLKLSNIANQRTRNNLGQFVNEGKWATRKFSLYDMQKAFFTGQNMAYSKVSMSPSRRFEIFCKQNKYL